MANVAIHVTGLVDAVSPSGQFAINCVARANGSIVAGFDMFLIYTDSAAQKQAAIEARAVAVLAEIGVIVGPSEKRTVFGGPNN